ncbi:MAG: tRNA epoxyqueuosine(34) reductase QueG [Bacteroidales bacterium 36-12]|nr:MAG: tRNA epoxyqueuosine(34) reductase QueG [Bacteroidales bacterium 36-12]
MHDFIRNTALSLGFDSCGIAKAEALTEDAEFMRSWLDTGQHGDMEYLNRNFEKRIDPTVLVPGCKSVVVVLMNYYPLQKQSNDLPQISKYAYSKIDYHTVLKTKLGQLETILTQEYGDEIISKEYQHSFVDTAPILEKRWAEKAGLGWIGKHTQLITPKLGSYVFIGILLLNEEVKPAETRVPFRCGTCTRCIDACPTQALNGRSLDATKCISYLTLEIKSDIPDDLKQKLSGWIAGCDICNDVCPWNIRFGTPNQHEEFAPAEAIFSLTKDDWQNMKKEEFDVIFGKSAVKRAKLERIQSRWNADNADNAD